MLWICLCCGCHFENGGFSALALYDPTAFFYFPFYEQLPAVWRIFLFYHCYILYVELLNFIFSWTRFYSSQCSSWTCSPQSHPIICKTLAANHRRWRESYPTRSSQATSDSVALSNFTLSATHKVAYPRNNTHVIITLSESLKLELCVWLCHSVWWPPYWCTNFT